MLCSISASSSLRSGCTESWTSARHGRAPHARLATGPQHRLARPLRAARLIAESYRRAVSSRPSRFVRPPCSFAVTMFALLPRARGTTWSSARYIVRYLLSSADVFQRWCRICCIWSILRISSPMMNLEPRDDAVRFARARFSQNTVQL